MVAMSGGVDSSVAALMLTNEGYDVSGVTMCLGIEAEEDSAKCCGAAAVDDAKRVCDRLKIPHYVFDYALELEDKVIANFISEYQKGRTPNPCVECNRYLKFGSLLKKAKVLGFDFLVDGSLCVHRTKRRWLLSKEAEGQKKRSDIFSLDHAL